MARDLTSLRLLVAFGAAVVWVWLSASGLSFVLAPGSVHLLLCPGGIALGLLVRHRGDSRQDRLIATFEAVSLFGVVCLLGAIACYPAAAASHGWADPSLARADRALGLDWLAYHHWVQSSPLLASVLKIAYSSIFITPSVIVPWLVLSGQMKRAYRFILLYAVALAIAILCFVALPAAGADAFYLGMDSNGVSEGTLRQIAMIKAMQSGALHVVSSSALIGPISFPSFHVASAILFTWAAWPIRMLRWPVAAVNAVMIAATPIYGGHYFVDLIAGAALAMFCVVILRVRWRGVASFSLFGSRVNQAGPAQTFSGDRSST